MPRGERRAPGRVTLAYAVVTFVTLGVVGISFGVVSRSLDRAAQARAGSASAHTRIASAGDVLGYAVRIEMTPAGAPMGQLSAEMAQAIGSVDAADTQARRLAAPAGLRAADLSALEALRSQTQGAHDALHDEAKTIADAVGSVRPERTELASAVDSLATRESAYVDALKAEAQFYDAIAVASESEARTESTVFALLMLLVFAVAIGGVIAPAHRRAAAWRERSIRSEEQEARIGSEVLRHAAERDRREAEAQFQALFRHSTVGVALTDQRGWILESNEALQRILGYTEEELRGSQFGEWAIDTGAPITHGTRSERLYRRKNGTTLWVDQTSTVAPGSGDAGLSTIWMVQDIEKRKNAERQLQFDATHDGLTGLRNRGYFDDAIERAVRNARLREGVGFAVCMIDLDRFKYVNDTRGHAAGDYVLAEVGHRLRAWAFDEIVVARYGGDEFAAFIPDVVDPAEAIDAVARLQHLLDAPMTVLGMTLQMTASVGVCLWDPAFEDGEEILRAADSAAYRAKGLGRARVVVYDSSMAQHDNLRRRIGVELKHAIENGEMWLAYQPIVSLPDRSCLGFEALARWTHPKLGDVAPSVFVPVAEELGLMNGIGSWILREACEQLARWQSRECGRRLKLNVNVSPQQMCDPAFPAIVRDCLTRAGISAADIALELTETAMLDGRGAGNDNIALLRQMGLSIVLDDFGTGYSSLSYLQLLPMDALKVDQSFIKGPYDGLASPAIVHALITLSRTLGISAVAEGVETEKQASLLNHMGCRTAQGFLFSRPLGADDAFDYLTRSGGQAQLA